MKVKKLTRKIYKACIDHDTKKEKMFWSKAIKKSLKHKRTEVVQ